MPFVSKGNGFQPLENAGNSISVDWDDSGSAVLSGNTDLAVLNTSVHS